jgi:hypothetical protein
VTTATTTSPSRSSRGVVEVDADAADAATRRAPRSRAAVRRAVAVARSVALGRAEMVGIA